jgi:probable F420-dependent oxidoreductase
MKIGVVYPQIEVAGDVEAVKRITRAVEDLGFDYMLAYDHVVGAPHDRDPPLAGPYTEKDPFHDPFVLFSYAAAITERIELVTGILILPQRQTVLVAKQAADLDLLSNQRLRLGVGPGWNYVEYDALGMDFHTRGRRLDEQIGFLRELWGSPLLTYAGKFDHIDRGNINLRPKRQIPIWAGGGSEPAYRRGRLVEGFIFAGDAKHAFGNWERVRHHLLEAGRSEDGFGRDLITFPLSAPGPREVVDQMNLWRDMGGTHACVTTTGKGFKSVDQHIDHLADVRALLTP